MPAAAPMRKAREHAPQRRPDMRPELAGGGEGLEGREDAARRRHEAALGKAGAHRNFPGERDEDRQKEAEKHPRIDRGALPGEARGPRERRTPSREEDQASGRHGALPWRRHAQRAAVEKRRSTSVVDGGLHIVVGRHDARLLKREAGGEDRSICGWPMVEWVSLGALELALDHRLGELGVVDERLLQLRRVGEREGARLLVGLEHLRDEVRILLGECLAHVQDAPGIGGRVAVEERRAALDLGRRHQRIEAGPGIDVAALEGRAAVRMLKEDELHVLLGQLRLLQGAHEEDVRIGAAGDGDALALEVLDLGDARVLAGDEGRPFGPRIDVDRLDRVAVDLADQRRGAGRRAEIERAGIEEFERLVGAERLHPAHRDAVLGELALEDALVLEDEADRVIGGIVDAEFLHLRGRVRVASERRRGDGGGEERYDGRGSSRGLP